MMALDMSNVEKNTEKNSVSFGSIFGVQLRYKCQFHQHVCGKIPKAQKGSQVMSVFLRFWDLPSQKLRVNY